MLKAILNNTTNAALRKLRTECQEMIDKTLDTALSEVKKTPFRANLEEFVKKHLALHNLNNESQKMKE